MRTTVDPRLQKIADKVLRKGLVSYDRRHGWRGPFLRLGDDVSLNAVADWRSALARIERPKGLFEWSLAVVLTTDKNAATIGLEDGSVGLIPAAELRWARKWSKDQSMGQ